MEEAFSRSALVVGENAVACWRQSRVAVFGIGGVGSAVVEVLARAGVGALDLIDRDTVSVSNLNRQLIATVDAVGEDKVAVATRRVLSIAPSCRVTAIKTFFLNAEDSGLDFSQYDYVVDAIDTVTGKLGIIEASKKAGVPVISCMGTGNKLDATAFRVTDISDTTGCPLARIMRKELKKRGIEGVKAVWSPEEPVEPAKRLTVPESGKPVPGSLPFIPPVAGMIMAGEVLKDLAHIQ